MAGLGSLTAWERMGLVKAKGRPNVDDYIGLIFTDFMELHGDRYYGDDAAIKGGIAWFYGQPVTVISQVKGKNLEENKKSNFAMPHPEGYRKALRLAKQAEKFHRPVITLIDTPGAFCGIQAEERGQGEAIARNLYEFMRLKTPVVSVVLGEGGSGGALALAVCDRLGVLENAVYSVISPRGCANILWKDPSREQEAANLMKITAQDLLQLEICEEVIEEASGGAHNNMELTAENIEKFIKNSFATLCNLPIDIMLATRYDKFRKIGDFIESDQQ